MFLKNRNISLKIKRSKVTDYAALRIPFSLSDVIPNASFDQTFFIFSGLGVSGSQLSFSNVNIWETYFQ